jgi:WD40 repeat protein
MAFELPKEKTKIKTANPKNLIIFGLPKVGKTTVLSMLPKALIIDLENGTDYVESYAVKADSYIKLFEIAKALKESPNQFDFIVLDTITALEDMVLPYANKLYRETSMGVNFDANANILKLPNGAGYLYVREAMQNVIGWFTKVSENVILVGHVKDKALNENGTELNIKDLDLTGKLGRILSAASDGICYVYRDVDSGDLMANFGEGNSVLCGARMAHLSGKSILLSSKDKETGEITAFWNNIYPSLND